MPPPQQEKLRFHVLSDGLGDVDKALLKGIAASREGTEVRFCRLEQNLPKETLELIERSAVSVPSHVTKSTYYRILAADLLPTDAHRALYLDGDVLCTGSLEELFSLDLKGCACGMCYGRGAASIPTYNRLGYPPEEGYFNAGVILYDLDLWRREGISRAMLNRLAASPMDDQNLINACLHGRILPLDYSYNVMSVCFYVFYWLQQEKNNYLAASTQYLPKSEWPALLAACEHPRLVHIFEALKPWHRDSTHPFTPVWRYFYAASPWKGERLKRCRLKLSAKAKAKRLARRALERINLVAKQSIPYPEEARMSAQRVLDGLQAEDRGT